MRILSLGCRDPVERIAEIKAADPTRRAILAVFETWWAHHEGREVKAADLHDAVKVLLDPKAVVVDGKLKASRQVIAWWLQRHKGTRIGGYWLEEVRDAHRKRQTVTYRLHDGSEKFGRLGNGAVANVNFQTTTTNLGAGFSKFTWLRILAIVFSNSPSSGRDMTYMIYMIFHYLPARLF
jgi:hypothetical protein